MHYTLEYYPTNLYKYLWHFCLNSDHGLLVINIKKKKKKKSTGMDISALPIVTQENHVFPLTKTTYQQLAILFETIQKDIRK